MGPLRRSPLFPAVAFGLVLVASTAFAEPSASISEASGAAGGVSLGTPFDDFDDEEDGDVFEPENASRGPSEAAGAADQGKPPSAKRRTRAKAQSKKISQGALVPSGTLAGPVAGPGLVRAWTEVNLAMLAASPVPGVESSGFGWRDDPINNRRKFHKGNDFRAPRGTPVFAAGGGTVSFAGRMGGYGNVIFIDHGGGVTSRYGHLRRIGTKRNAQVVAGAQIGEVGSTGRSTGPHLHFEVRLDGRAVNPKVAMTVADLQRRDPTAARSAMAALAPEVQQASVDPHRKAGKRPDRRARTKRTQVLW